MTLSRTHRAALGGTLSVLIGLAAAGLFRQTHDTSLGPSSALLIATPLPAGARAHPSTAAIVHAWQQATPLSVPLTGGAVTALQVTAVYSAQVVYFRLHWPESLQNVPGPAVQQQQATMTWKRSEAIGGCAVVCHVSFSAGRRIDTVQVVAPDITAAPFTIILDQWQDGWWTLGYARPLVTSDIEDIQFTDLHRTYPFGLDVAEGAGSAHTHGEAFALRFG